MSLYKNRFLVLVGGETTVAPSGNQSEKPKSPRASKGSNSGSGSEEESENNNMSLGDVWVFDMHLRAWQELKPSIRVQTVFNNKKMRKTFEPRMAHTATVVHGNYIVFFGGFCTQTSTYLHANFAVLSLSGCTDYILSKPLTYSDV